MVNTWGEGRGEQGGSFSVFFGTANSFIAMVNTWWEGRGEQGGSFYVKPTQTREQLGLRGNCAALELPPSGFFEM
eukprot:CAMPEP_0113561588 /NCGR_PEP_ID=MMETSP0015_2-20120614/20058_1 /TAXON_ID=2838 /ORGANISM="Odontella" /LENGTH=74 /DNA_ID=CAMNT_0000463397 /DNA_START=189 /DNA_END=413 /DNA_ORIENTATION=- /assembly_acc=CAM_ASM_000160